MRPRRMRPAWVAAIGLLVAGREAAGQPRLQARVWVNTESQVYHCPGSSHYGTTRRGEFMSEAQARGRGVRAAEGRGCGASASPRQAPGGGEGRVWVNLASGVYVCPGDRNYGTTRQGAYMPEDSARAAGHRPAANKGCER